MALRALHWPAVRVSAPCSISRTPKRSRRFDDVEASTGTHEGKPLPPQAKVGDVFRHLEFSHGHNLLTLNGMTRLGNSSACNPTSGPGGHRAAHTEIGFRSENGRTYEYQYAGLVGQALAGLEVRLGRVSVVPRVQVHLCPLRRAAVRRFQRLAAGHRSVAATHGVARKRGTPGGRLSTTLITPSRDRWRTDTPTDGAIEGSRLPG